MVSARHVVLGAALAIAFLFRFAGLAHDVAEGFSYHPDTAKQVRAVERFVQGDYLHRVGQSDYDGYAYFNSRLVEFLWRAWSAGAAAAAALIGIEPADGGDSALTFLWLKLLLNATLSTLAIAVVWRFANEAFGLAVATLAAVFLALSPVDVAACHYATADTTAGVFALVAVSFAFRVFRYGRARDSVLATLFTVLAAATKYHAVFAAVPVAGAHVARFHASDGLLAAASFRRILLCVVTALLALPLAIPSLLVNPIVQVQDILAFADHIGRFGMPEELAGKGPATVFFFSMQKNLPILVEVTSPFLLVAAVAGIVAAGVGFGVPRERKAVALAAALPITYWFLGVGLRPQSHAVYHTVMTPFVFVLAAAVVVELWRRRPFGTAALRLLAAVVVVGGVVSLWRVASREAFFFSLDDTREVSGDWVAENVPASFPMLGNPYGFERDQPVEFSDGDRGRVRRAENLLAIDTNLRPHPVPHGAQLLRRFALEESPLPLFRNPRIDLWLRTPLLAEGFRVPPLLARLPTSSAADLVIDGGPTFYRDPKEFRVVAEHPVWRTLVASRPLDEVVVRVQAGEFATRVRATVGGVSMEIPLAAAEARAARLRRPRPIRISSGRWFYEVELVTALGDVDVRIATAAPETGLALVEGGDLAGGAVLLAEATGDDASPEIAALAAVSAAQVGESVDPRALERARRSRIGDDDAHDARTYLDALDYLAVEAEEARFAGYEVVERRHPSGGVERRYLRATLRSPQRAVSGRLRGIVEPGHYSANVLLACRSGPPMPLTARLSRLGRDEAVSTTTVECDGQKQFVERRLSLHVADALPDPDLVVEVPAKRAHAIDRIELAPDVARNEAALASVFEMVDGGDPAAAAAEPTAFRPMLALGDRRLAAADRTGAERFWVAAARLRPDRIEPIERLARLGDRLSEETRGAFAADLAALRENALDRPLEPSDGEFAAGVRLSGYRLPAREARAGGAFPLELVWEVSDVEVRAPERLTVWVHAIDAKGNVVFQGDRALLDDLDLDVDRGLTTRRLRQVEVPATVASGSYRIALGLHYLREHRRSRVVSTTLERHGGGIVLPETLTILRSAEEPIALSGR